ARGENGFRSSYGPVASAMDSELVLVGVAADEQVLEVDRAAGGVVGQPLDFEDRVGRPQPEELLRLGIRRAGPDLDVGMPERYPELVLEHREEVAREITRDEPRADVGREVADIDRYRLPVQVAHTLDLDDVLLLAEPQCRGDLLRGTPRRGRDELRGGREARGLHRFLEALQALEALRRLRLADEGSLALRAEDEPLVVQIPKRLAHGDAAHPERAHQLVLGGELLQRQVHAVEDALLEHLLDLQVERLRGVLEL